MQHITARFASDTYGHGTLIYSEVFSDRYGHVTPIYSEDYLRQAWWFYHILWRGLTYGKTALLRYYLGCCDYIVFAFPKRQPLFLRSTAILHDRPAVSHYLLLFPSASSSCFFLHLANQLQNCGGHCWHLSA